MNREISQEEAEKKLEQIAKESNWSKVLPKKERESFLTRYRALHAQLRREDELKLEILEDIYNGRGRIKVNCPSLHIILYESNGKKRKVCSYTGTDIIGSELLYSD